VEKINLISKLKVIWYNKNSMKILIVITHGKIGGATNFVFWLAKGLKEKNVEVKVAFGEGEYLKEKLEQEKISYVNFKWLKRTRNPLSNLFFIFEIKKFLDKEKFDVVHFNSTNALFGAIGAKIAKNKPKTVFTFHGLSVLDPNYKKGYLLKIIYWLTFKFLLLFIDTPVFVCKNNLEVARKIKLIKNGVVIYNGIPMPEFLEREVARKFFEEKTKMDLKEKFIIGSIGRLDYAKNYEFIIRNFSEILKNKPNAICIIIGDGPERKKYDNLIKKLKLQDKIFLIGELSNAPQYIKGFDLFILPSRYEGLSITLIEAVFAQIPILASDVGGNKEIVNENCVFNLNNKEGVLDKIKKSEVPISKKEFFAIEKMTKEYFNLFGSFNKTGQHSPSF
jgi:glycosyltransferase involved in cell wall biosynthesis